MSLDDAAGSTHIRYKYLEALENDHYDLLPSSVQGRGFLRAYAEFLELDPTPLLKNWETRSLVPDEPVQPQPMAVIEPDRPEVNFPSTEAGPQPEIEVEPPALSEDIPEIIEKPEQPVVSGLRAISPNSENSQSAAHFSVVSSTLRNQREILGLSLNDIEQYTHIRHFYLQAIEEGRFQDLPSPVQAKGMIENYAQFLDINSDELMLEYAEGLQAQREEKLALEQPTARSGGLSAKKSAQSGTGRLASGRPATGNPAAGGPTRKSLSGKLLTPDLLIGSFVIIFLVAFAIWTTGRVIASRNSQANATIPGISDVLVSTTSPMPETATEATQLVVSTIDLNAANSANATTEETQATDFEETEALSEGLVDGTQTTPAVVFDENAPIQLNIVIQQRTYLKVIVDNEIAFEGRSQPGDVYPYSAAESIELIAGNAAALQITYNQTDMGIIGSFGQVVNLIFKGGAVMTPTPLFTPSPTGTFAPTMTLQMPTNTPTPTVTPYIP